ncbi:MAG TPA: polymer-forming cytoskeletal protein [Methylomirabilota bacterium]|nr:polymer-forming cytoskeletal protein [Methylomirabilota bacterium]
MFRRGGKEARRGRGTLTAYIDEGSAIEGRYTFRGTVMLNGTFKGEISSNDTLIIGERATVEADIRAGRLEVSGAVTGNLEATERIDLKRTARVTGDVRAPVVVVEEGVLFDGHCRMSKPAARPDAGSPRDLAVVPLKR